MTDIFEDLKSGRLVVVPREATGAAVNAAWHEGKSRRLTGLPNDFRAVLDSALTASPDHTAGLIALVEGMERGRDEAKAQLRTGEAQYGVLDQQNKHLLARALAAEAERDALREALAGLIHNIDTAGGTHGAMSDARRALKEKSNADE